MKNSILIISLFLLLANTSFAQNNSADNRENIHFGLKAGISYSNVYDAQGDQFNADAKFGFSGGAFVAIPITSLFGIQPEFLLTQKGFKGSGNILGFPYSFKKTSTFFEIPILLAFKPTPFITILAGPQYSFLLKEKYEFTSSIINTLQENEFEQDNIRKNILGFVAGMDINMSKVVLSGRIGFDIQDNKGDGTSSTPRYKNVSGQIGLGFRL